MDTHRKGKQAIWMKPDVVWTYGASILTGWHPPTTADVTVETVPPEVADGDNVLILIDGLPKNIIGLAWYKGVNNLSLIIAVYSLTYDISVEGPVYSGRETIYRNGSLLIQNVTRKDTGFYTIRTINRNGEFVSKTTMHLQVYSSFWVCERPSIFAKFSVDPVPPSVAEGENVMLLVHALPQKLLAFFWYKGVLLSEDNEVARYRIDTKSSAQGPAHSGREMVYSNGSLLLQKLTWKDIGFYTLKTLTTDLKNEVLHVQLEVDNSRYTQCYHRTRAPVMIERVPQNVAVGENVLLLVHNAPDLQTFSWYKSVERIDKFKIVEYNRAMNSTTWGPEETIREKVYTNGSMLLNCVTEKDAGFYTLQTLSRDLKIEVTRVLLHVYKPVTNPFIQVTNNVVTVQSSVVFTCYSPDARISIHWFFNDQTLQLTERMKLSPTKCRLTIDPVMIEDAGVYRCETSNLVSSKRSMPVSLMAMSLVFPCKGCAPWLYLLLIASLLTCWHLPTTAQITTTQITTAEITIESVPSQVIEGENILIYVKNMPGNHVPFAWFKGMGNMSRRIALYAVNAEGRVMEPVHSGRETIYSNGSLQISKVTQKDTGFYTLQLINRQGEIVSNISTYLHVYSSLWMCGHPPTSLQLSIELVPPSVAKGRSILLLIHNLPKNLQTLFWYKGVIAVKKFEVARHIIATNSSVSGPAHSGRETLYSNGSLLLQSVTLSDTGFYTLRTLSTDLKAEVAHVQLHVDDFLSTFCKHLTRIMIESVPQNVAVGKDVLLLVHNLPEDFVALFWYKSMYRTEIFKIAEYSQAMDSTILGPAYSGRELLYANGSLQILDVTEKDAGVYMLEILNRGLKIKKSHVQLHVNSQLLSGNRPPTSAQLSIKSVPPSVAEGGSVLLLIHNLPKNSHTLFWYKGMIAVKNFEIVQRIIAASFNVPGPAHSGRETVYNNGSLLLRGVTLNDTGFYTLQILRTDLKAEVAHVQLHMDAPFSPHCNRLISVQVKIKPVPRNVAVGKDVLLLVRNLPKDFQEFFWYKSVYRTDLFKIAEYIRATDSTIWGLAHSGREMVYTSGSLLIKEVTEEDAGLYMLEILNRNFKIEKAYVQLHVNKPVTEPFVRVTDTAVTVQSSVVFTCFSPDHGISIQWFFNNQSLQLTERMTLSPTKCQLSIDPTRMEDAGDYQCEVSNPVSSQTSMPVSLVVMDV
ncbi:carcinoembryonic antigen-related cell adhesion molecule 3-like [Acomys russatus]|uniref:carcinoembryonic antigen-related cell adhesion molecule 3-like n=1 Tax=Acomys russatus TaxID=60746 RepID=UPI0021E2BD87|nr:carcinoembryonic antigen-related cell adhesion molecule 3-like [Acomys russatus]